MIYSFSVSFVDKSLKVLASLRTPSVAFVFSSSRNERNSSALSSSFSFWQGIPVTFSKIGSKFCPLYHV